MKVVFLDDVEGVALGGDVKEVKNGFARNYLIPKKLAVPATPSALQRVKRLTHQAETDRTDKMADYTAMAEELDGVQVNIEMRAAPSGRLYGSVNNATVAKALSTLTSREIERRVVAIPEPFREIGLFDVKVALHPEVEAQVKVLVYPSGTDPDEMMQSTEDEVDEEEPAAEAEAVEVTAEPEAEAGEQQTAEGLVDESTEGEVDEEEPAVEAASGEAEPEADEQQSAEGMAEESAEGERDEEEPAVEAASGEAEPGADEQKTAEDGTEGEAEKRDSK